jgi:dolichyl-phosphate-mannose-protein mannosyltransferase
LRDTPAPAHIAYNSIISLKNRRLGGGLLHSHEHLYPEEFSGHQQVTSYSFKDDNNHWKILPIYDAPQVLAETQPVKHVLSGDKIRLLHVPSNRFLQVAQVPAPLSQGHLVVSAGTNESCTFSNDVWTIKLSNGTMGCRISRIFDSFQLVHLNTGHTSAPSCYLHSSGSTLPADWGFEQVRH